MENSHTNDVSVFKISSDVENYRWACPSDDSFFHRYQFNGSPIDNWRIENFFIHDLKKKEGAFFKISSSLLAFSKETLDVYAPLFERCGDIHEIFVEEVGVAYLLNIRNCVNPVNKGQSEWKLNSRGERVRPIGLVFHENRLPPEGLFKIPELNYGAILTHTNRLDSNLDFIKIYEENSFTGLKFTEIWSN